LSGEDKTKYAFSNRRPDLLNSLFNLKVGTFSNYVLKDYIFECDRLIFHHT
jgi:hypothetical protein